MGNGCCNELREGFPTSWQFPLFRILPRYIHTKLAGTHHLDTVHEDENGENSKSPAQFAHQQDHGVPLHLAPRSLADDICVCISLVEVLQSVNGSASVVVRFADPVVPEFRIRNHTPHDLGMRQVVFDDSKILSKAAGAVLVDIAEWTRGEEHQARAHEDEPLNPAVSPLVLESSKCMNFAWFYPLHADKMRLRFEILTAQHFHHDLGKNLPDGAAGGASSGQEQAAGGEGAGGPHSSTSTSAPTATGTTPLPGAPAVAGAPAAPDLSADPHQAVADLPTDPHQAAAAATSLIPIFGEFNIAHVAVHKKKLMVPRALPIWQPLDPRAGRGGGGRQTTYGLSKVAGKMVQGVGAASHAAAGAAAHGVKLADDGKDLAMEAAEDAIDGLFSMFKEKEKLRTEDMTRLGSVGGRCFWSRWFYYYFFWCAKKDLLCRSWCIGVQVLFFRHPQFRSSRSDPEICSLKMISVPQFFNSCPSVWLGGRGCMWSVAGSPCWGAGLSIVEIGCRETTATANSA